MGTIRNRMTIIHHYDLAEIKEVRKNAIAYFSEIMKEYNDEYKVSEDMVSPILTSPMNGEYSFVIMGDCSKLGWEMSENFEKHRNKWVKEQVPKVQNIIIADFGEGDYPALIEEF